MNVDFEQVLGKANVSRKTLFKGAAVGLAGLSGLAPVAKTHAAASAPVIAKDRPSQAFPEVIRHADGSLELPGLFHIHNIPVSIDSSRVDVARPERGFIPSSFFPDIAAAFLAEPGAALMPPGVNTEAVANSGGALIPITNENMYPPNQSDFVEILRQGSFIDLNAEEIWAGISGRTVEDYVVIDLLQHMPERGNHFFINRSLTLDPGNRPISFDLRMTSMGNVLVKKYENTLGRNLGFVSADQKRDEILFNYSAASGNCETGCEVSQLALFDRNTRAFSYSRRFASGLWVVDFTNYSV